MTNIKLPKLVIMAAGMGSRFGGLKQITPMDDFGHLLIDFSIYDAIQAGFKDIVFIIKHEIEADFRAAIGNRIEKAANVSYVFQELDMLPKGFTVPEGRVKPWGTSHAILCCKDVLGDSSFVPLNADDFYGRNAFAIAFNFLMNNHNTNEHCVIGYPIESTLTKHGHVSRGVCEIDESDNLIDIRERTKIKLIDGNAAYTEDEATYHKIPEGSMVSMNMWGFNSGMLNELEESFPKFLAENIAKNPLKCEDYLPEAVRRAVTAGRAQVKVIRTPDRWHGVTYAEDRPALMQAIAEYKAAGIYPEKLWE
jgi:NDP-sugar pyrophosphorylase family protein